MLTVLTKPLSFKVCFHGYKNVPRGKPMNARQELVRLKVLDHEEPKTNAPDL